MKKLFLALTLMAGTFGVFADDAPAAAPDPNAPTMTFDNDAIDYGTIKQDADGNRVFSFTNSGKTPIVISEAHGSCGCTVPTYPKEPIMPGQKAEIKVHYDTHRVGPFSKSVTVNSNAKNSPVVLKISGTVEAAAVVPTATEPSSIIPTPAPAPTITAPAAKTAVKSTTSKASSTATKTKSTVKPTTKPVTKTLTKTTGTK
ncbi:MAG: DUF1573 domain-containing protein [Sphingobacteriales bacterium]|nr:DUF1573 domain-containing protein [Sphingobacteriales bacterium]